MKLLAIAIAIFISFTTLAIDIDFDKYTNTEVESMALNAVQENCSALFNDGKLIKFVSYDESSENEENIVVIRVFGWRTNGLTGLIKMVFSRTTDQYSLVDFSPMPSSVCL